MDYSSRSRLYLNHIVLFERKSDSCDRWGSTLSCSVDLIGRHRIRSCNKQTRNVIDRDPVLSCPTVKRDNDSVPRRGPSLSICSRREIEFQALSVFLARPSDCELSRNDRCIGTTQ